MEAWRRVEVARRRARSREQGAVRPTTSRRSASARRSPSRRCSERERVTDHDVAAFVDVLAASAGEAGRWIHFGLTSSDVLDTALALQLRAAGEILVRRRRRARRARWPPRARARRHALRRPHPRRPRRADDVRRQARRLRLRGAPQRAAAGAGRSRRSSVGALSGAVGTYAAHEPGVRGARARAAGPGARATSPPRSSRATATPSCWRRSRWRAPASSASPPRSATCSAPRCARSRSRSASGQKGSSRDAAQAQPDQAPSRSPASRGCCAATRRPALENVALWHERDISHSSVERVILPDSTILLDYAAAPARCASSTGMPVDAERMRENLELTHGALFSQRVLLALVEGGMRATTPTGSSRSSRSARGTRARRCATCSPRERARRGPRPRRDLRPTARYVRHAHEIVGRLDAIALTALADARPLVASPAVTTLADLPLLASGKVREMYDLAGTSRRRC